MQNEIHETTEGFIFAIIDGLQAKMRLKNQESVFRLHTDYTESLIEDENDINDTLRDKDKFGAEIGFKSELLQEFEEGEQNRFRNNDFRNFEEWLNDKINVILE